MQFYDLLMLSGMWACFAVTFFLIVSSCAVFFCRRGIVKQHSKVQVLVHARPGGESGGDSNNVHGRKGSNSHKVQPTFTNNDRYQNDNSIDNDGMNAFNTEDALKQSVNPTHAIAFPTARTNPDLDSTKNIHSERANTVTSRD